MGAGLVGAGLIVLVAGRFALHVVLCSAWPTLAVGFTFAAIYTVAIGLLAFAWHRIPAIAVAAVHGVALLASPFLSSDPLMYAAVGKALSIGASVTTGLSDALGAGHPFLVPLPPAWRAGTSAYGPAWNHLAGWLGAIASDDLALGLRLHQAVACVALLLGAWIVSLSRDRDRSAAFVLVAACPLAILEATVGAHNDSLLIPLVAAALWAWSKRWPFLSVALLACGLVIKASALLLVGPVVLTMMLAKLPSRPARIVLLVACCGLGFVALFAFGALAIGPLDAVARIVGSPNDPFDHCTRSLECLPRVVLRFVAHAPFASWVTGIVFRVVGMAWIAYTALRAAEAPREEAVSWLARGLYFYFLILHGWAQSWYLLPLLPTLPFLVEDSRWAPAIRLYLVTGVLYYALVLPMSCLDNPVLIAVSDLVEAMITVFPPTYLLLRSSPASPNSP